MPDSEWPELAFGPASRMNVATAPEVDVVISAIVGVAGLEATYEAVKQGKTVGLANKEVLVSGGELVMKAVRQSGAELIPVVGVPVLVALLPGRGGGDGLGLRRHRCLNRGLHRRLHVRLGVGDRAGSDGDSVGFSGSGGCAATARATRRIVLLMVAAT